MVGRRHYSCLGIRFCCRLLRAARIGTPHMLSYLGNLCVGSQGMIPHIEQRSGTDTNLSQTNDTLFFVSKKHHIANCCNAIAATMDRFSTRIIVRDAYLCLAVHLLGLGVSSGRVVEYRLRL